MEQFDSSSVAGLFGSAVLALLALVMGIQKLVKNWQATSAETSVITMMHQELSRMSAQNTSLTTELNKLQMEIINLNRELGVLSLENQRLHVEVVALTKEVARLQTILVQGGVNDSTN